MRRSLLFAFVAPALLLAACGTGTLGGADVPVADAPADPGAEQPDVQPDGPPDAAEVTDARPDRDTMLPAGRCDQTMTFPTVLDPVDEALDTPSGVAVRGGLLWVADPAAGRLLQFTTSGTYVQRWTGFEGYDGAFRPSAIAVTDERVFVTDVEAGRLISATPSGLLVGVWGDSGADALIEPRGLAVQGDEVWVADAAAGVLRVFGGTAGSLLRTVGRGVLKRPVSLAFDGEQIVVADEERRQVVTVTGTGVEVHATDYEGELVQPTGVAITGGTLFVSDRGTARLLRATLTGELVSSCGGEGGGAGQLSRPRGLALDDQGYVYVSDTGNRRVVRIYPDGLVR